MVQGHETKSFKEIYDQVLAEMQARRQKAATFQRSSPVDRPSYILKTSSRPSQGKPFPEAPSPSPKAPPQPFFSPRTLTKLQREALECFRQHGEMVDEKTGTVELKKAFRRLAKRFHPDKASGLNPEQQKLWAQEFLRIHQAYQNLLDLSSHR